MESRGSSSSRHSSSPHSLGKDHGLSGSDDPAVALVSLLLAHGADVTIQDNEGYTPLHCLAMNIQNVMRVETSSTVASMLYEHEADPNVSDEHGQTPLHRLVSATSTDILSHDATLSFLMKLIEMGTDLNVRDKAGQTALHCFVKKAQANPKSNIPIWKELDILLQHGANPTLPDDLGKLPLDYCSDLESFNSTLLFLFVQSMMSEIWR